MHQGVIDVIITDNSALFSAFFIECQKNSQCFVYTYFSDTKTCTFSAITASPVEKTGAYSAARDCNPILPWQHSQR